MDGSDAQNDRTGQFDRPGTERPDPFGLSQINVVHELNNLLTIVLGNLERLRRQHLDEAGREQLEQTETAARRAGVLLRRITEDASS